MKRDSRVPKLQRSGIPSSVAHPGTPWPRHHAIVSGHSQRRRATDTRARGNPENPSGNTPESLGSGDGGRGGGRRAGVWVVYPIPLPETTWGGHREIQFGFLWRGVSRERSLPGAGGEAKPIYWILEIRRVVGFPGVRCWLLPPSQGSCLLLSPPKVGGGERKETAAKGLWDACWGLLGPWGPRSGHRRGLVSTHLTSAERPATMEL